MKTTGWGWSSSSKQSWLVHRGGDWRKMEEQLTRHPHLHHSTPLHCLKWSWGEIGNIAMRIDEKIMTKIIQRVRSYFFQPVSWFFEMFCILFWKLGGIKIAVSGICAGEELGEVGQAEVQVDVVSGSGITLQCRSTINFIKIGLRRIHGIEFWKFGLRFWNTLSRFDPALSEKTSTLYWIRSNRRNHDTAAIGETAFDQDYRWESRLQNQSVSCGHLQFWIPLVLIFVDHTTRGVLGALVRLMP